MSYEIILIFYFEIFCTVKINFWKFELTLRVVVSDFLFSVEKEKKGGLPHRRHLMTERETMKRATGSSVTGDELWWNCFSLVVWSFFIFLVNLKKVILLNPVWLQIGLICAQQNRKWTGSKLHLNFLTDKEKGRHLIECNGKVLQFWQSKWCPST